MVMIIPPKYAVSMVVGKMKGMTGSKLRKKLEWLSKRYWRENMVWSPGYLVSIVGIEEEKILKYVEYQGRQDSGQAKLDLLSATGLPVGIYSKESRISTILS